MTYIKVGCPKCGRTYTKAIYGFVNEPIGISLSQCSGCGEVFMNKMHKEWIQMSNIKKFFSVAPRGNICIIPLPILICFLLLKLFFPGVLDAEKPDNVGTTMLLFGAIIAIFYIFFLYVTVCIRINSSGFQKRYISSIQRTRNETYKSLLEKTGTIYGEEIPKFIWISSKTREKYNKILSGLKAAKNISVPNLYNSITNI